MGLKLKGRLVSLIVGSVLVASVTLGVSSYFSERASTLEGVEKVLVSIREARTLQLATMIGVLQEDLRLLTGSPETVAAVSAFDAAWNDLPGDRMAELHKSYIQNNPNPAGSKHLLDAAPDGTSYDQAHGRFHNSFRTVLETKGLYDIFLVRADGEVVYTVFKELDFATNLLNGKWKATGLADAFRLTAENPEAGKVYNSGYEPYAPSNDAPAMFFSSPVVDSQGNFLGAVILQAPTARFNEVMQVATGLGETGEAYLVGPDKRMLTDSRFSSEGTALKVRVDGDAVTQSIAGNSGLAILTDYKGREVMSAYGGIDVGGFHWGVIVDQSMAEISNPLDTLLVRTTVITLIVLLVVSGIAYLVCGTVTTPIIRLTAVMKDLAAGDLETEVSGRKRTDEIGAMAVAVQVFKENAIRVRDLEAEQKAAEERAVAEKRATMETLANDFESSVGSIVDGVSSASTELNGTAKSMSSISRRVNEQASSVASSSAEASSNVQTVAAASDELSASIQEISRQVVQSTSIAMKAVEAVTGTTRRMESLEEAASRIGAVVGLINDIAEQTNLLALNATIEAARAGEAGKGFAVVASEVKNLANQTAKATDEIGGQVGGVETATREAVESMRSIGLVIEEMSEISNAIAAAIEEQNAATGEIARNVQEASTRTDDVSRTIVNVTEASTEAGNASEEVLSASSELSRQAEELREQLTLFITKIRKGS